MDLFRAARNARVIALCAALVGAATYLHAQNNAGEVRAGEVRLTVKDPSGAAIVASGTLRNAATGATHAFRTDSNGTYILENLPFGRYRLEVVKKGFAVESSLIEVQSPTPIEHTVRMVLAPQAAEIDVVAPTALPGTDLALDDIPAPVQTATARDVENSGSLNLADLLNRRLNSVQINENQVNPFQPDVNYRGYTASPLLGTPEGISVYVDGVRQNQPFGDIVAWDLIPQIAISELALMPGSNPLFGLNTLGGAISIQTKDGFSQPGATLQLSGGSFGRRAGQFEYGGSNSKGLNWYTAGNLFREDGWRQFSPSEVRQAFAKLGWARDKTSVALSFGYADNWLTGNGLQDTRSLAKDYASVYTIPDITWNRSPSVNLTVRHDLASNFTLSGNAYFRYIRADTTNGDINDDSFDQSLYNLSASDIRALTAAGYRGFPTTGNYLTQPYPYWRCIAQGLEKDEPSEKCTGLITNTFNKQNNYGLSGQAAWFFSHNHLTFGGVWDRSSVSFQQASQFGYLSADHLTITPIDAYADGSTNADGLPYDTRANLHGLINTGSFYITDTINVGNSLAFTLSGRYNHTAVTNRDNLPIDPTGARGSLNGHHIFDRFNPAVGVTYRPVHYASLYFSYSEASRAPTAIELGCADPDEPCNLPNALVGDPPLKQVVTRTFEAGLRSAQENILRWNVGWFHAENYDDLLFVASQQTGFGYFRNFGKTRRQGAEVSLSGRIQHFTLGGNYTFLSTTYQSPEVVGSDSNSTNDHGDIAIQPGDYIPLIPRNLLKSYVDYQPTQKILIDLNFIAAGRSFVRGNENNLAQMDGLYYLGPGFSPGYGVLNLGAHYQLFKRLQFFVQINNLLNHRYYTAGQLGPTPYNDAGHFIARPFPANSDGEFPIRNTTFYAPGAPIGAWGGIRIRF